MKYKLINGSLNDIDAIKQTVFKNRSYNPIESTFSNISVFSSLKNMDKAVNMITSGKYKNATIIVDSDTDGYCSASMLINYLSDNIPEIKTSYLIHTDKKHGLSDDIDWESVECDLLIIPDAGTNDAEQCKLLSYKGIDVLILDHHIIEVENPYAVVVSSQDGVYPNSELCGTGVVWQFIRAIDDEIWSEDAFDYLEYVAIATVADIMDVTVQENRALIDEGLKQINHPLFRAIADKANAQLIGITGIDVQFSIVPFMNALIRVGSNEEKNLMFQALLQKEQFFDYKKRGSDEIIEESIYDRVARLCYNAKNRQKRSRTNSIDVLCKQIDENGLDGNKIIVVNGTKSVDPALTGMVASQLADRYGKPCLVLRKKNDDTYSGSGRNSSCSVVDDLRMTLLSTNQFDFVSGHANAFGVEICKSNITNMIDIINNVLPEDTDKSYYVDFIQNADVLDFDLIIKATKDIRKYCGEGFAEPTFVFEELVVSKEQVSIMGKDVHSWKISIDEGVDITKFFVPENDSILEWYYDDESDDEIAVTVYGTLGLNYWNGIVTGQMVVKDYEICMN